MKALLEKIRKILRDRKVRRALTRMVGGTSAVVVFVTTYALILPAITLEREAMCGIEAHQHDESCYSEELICEIPESDGHHHTDECYTVTRELICKLKEHIHSEENDCYDENGNLICEIQEHQHDDSCYEEIKTLTCGQEESDGHHHGPECYEKVLTCGKEAHTHSEECYKDESSAVAASTSSPAEAAQSETTYTEEPDESAASDATTSVLPEEMAEENLSEGLVPTLDPLYMDAMLTKDTAFYYYHPEEGEIVEDSSAIDRWEKVDRGTELKMTDLVKAYLPYTIPAGSLNQTNQVARYRLPYNLHLTDEQIRAINRNENVVAASVTDSDTEQDNSGYGSAYEKYLGAEAVEGKRKPNEELQGGDTEYISAVVKAENVYNESTGEYEGQDLIFIFTPYTIEENQDVYDQDGNMTAKGRKVSGWFAVDFNMSQIDWVEDETDADLDNTTIGKTAEFIFAEKDKEYGADEIRRELRLVEKKTEDDSSANMTTEEAEKEETSAEAETSAAAEEATSESTTENAAEAETASAGETIDAANADNTSEEFTSGTLEATGDGYKITLDYTAEAKIPADADLQVREITEASDKEAYEACLAEARKQVAGDDKSAVDQKASRFFDIEIVVKGTDESGKETITKIEPAAPVSVNIQLSETPAGNNTSEAVSGDSKSQTSDPTVLHFAEDGVEKLESTTGESQKKNTEQESTQVQFEAESFSVYGVVYTVDFYWEVNGKTFEYSLVGGDSVSVRSLVEVLGIAQKTEASEAENEESAESAVDEFINDIENVQFSNESLVKPVQITEGITAGALKDKLGLECEYSSELTNAQREQMDSKVYYVPDWALISLKPFTSEEYLTVEMKTGEVFRIQVTDAQIRKDYITASGETYTITVVYDDTAQIPDGSDLKVSEYEPGTEEYTQYLQHAAQKLDLTSSRLSFARFFDIEIIDGEGNKVEPKTPVQVEIAYKDPVEIGEMESLNIVHFAENGTEVISDAEVSGEGSKITYQQSSFSVTGTVIGANQVGGTESMILFKDQIGDNTYRYYIVNNDGSLTEVGYDEQKNEVIVTDPMLWTIDNSSNHIFFHSKETGFGTDLIASDYYRRYLDPSSDGATLEEISWPTNNQGQYVPATYQAGSGHVKVVQTGTFENKGKTIAITEVSDRTGAENDAALVIDSDGKIHQGSNYLAVVRDSSGNPVHLAGNQGSGEAAQFVFAEASRVPSGLHLQNAVNHIDISIQGDAVVDFPLAYGTYYYTPDQTGEPYYVTGDTKLTLTKDEAVNQNDLKITSEDMKRATITARDKNGNEINDAFYVTGFSGNAETDVSTVQVRIEGRFLCSDLRGTQYENIDSRRYDGYWEGWYYRWPDSNYVDAVRRARLQNVVDYTVTVVKPVEYWLKDSQGRQLYDDQGNKMKVTVDVAFSGSFNYWDKKEASNTRNSGNECPPIQGNAEWVAGDIPNHDLSGMDFVLHGTANNEESPVIALEITKYIMDDQGNVIKVKEAVTNTFDVFQNRTALPNSVSGMDVNSYQGDDQKPEYAEIYNGYEHAFTRPVTIEAGKGSVTVYRYNVPDGMYYIQERSDTDSLPETIEDTEGNVWTYEKTYIKTEYVRRDDSYSDGQNPMHVSRDYTERSEEYKSSPEVAGTFITMQHNVKRSGFLEYFVYNVYTKSRQLPVEKIWPEGTTPPDGAKVTADLYYRKRIRNQSQQNWSEFAKVEAGKDGFTESYSIELNDGNNWKNVFEELPVTWEDPETHTVYEFDYTAEESAVIVEGKNVQGAYTVTKDMDEETVTLTNEYETTGLDVEKDWADGTQPPEGAVITAELTYSARKVADADGNNLSQAGEWSEYTKVREGENLAELFAGDPLFDAANIAVSCELNEGNNWKNSFDNLPERIVGTDGTYEIKYSAVETAVMVGGKNAIGDYTVEKESTTEKATFTNAIDKTKLDVTKRWASGTEVPEGTEVTVELRYRARIKAADPQDENEWPEQYVPVKASGVFADLFISDPLLDEDNLVTEIILKESTMWTGTFNNLPKTLVDSEGVVYEIEYSSEETSIKVPAAGSTQLGTGETEVIDQYDSEVTIDENDNTKVYIDNSKKKVTAKVNKEWQPETPSDENAHAVVQLKRYKKVVPKAKTEATVVKVWDDGDNQDGTRPDSVTMHLLKNGEQYQNVTLNESNNWTRTIPDLDKTDDQDTAISYTWSEDTPTGYTMTQTTSGTVTTITNTHEVQTMNIRVVKVWDDDNDQKERRPESVTVHLFKDGELQDGQDETLSEENGWSATKRVQKGSEYSWTEETVQDYSITSNVTEGNTTTITNKYTPEMTSATVHKIWNDENDVDGIRPSSVTLNLKNGDQIVGTVELNEANSWTETVTDIPRRGAGGSDIEYTWEEQPVEGYTPTYEKIDGTNQTNVTNTHEREYVRPIVTFAWDDNDNVEGKRPESLDVDLYRGSEKVGTVTVTGPDWTGQISEADKLPKYEDGKHGEEIKYTWHEPNNFSGYYYNGSTVEGNTTTLNYGLKPPKDTVTFTLHTVSFVNQEQGITTDDGWSVSIENVKVDGNDCNPNSGFIEGNPNNNQPLVWEIPKSSLTDSSKISFECGITSGYQLYSITSPGRNQVIENYNNSGKPHVIAWLNEDDVDIYVVISDDSVQKPVPEPSDYIYLTIKGGGNNINDIPLEGFNEKKVKTGTSVTVTVKQKKYDYEGVYSHPNSPELQYWDSNAANAGYNQNGNSSVTPNPDHNSTDNLQGDYYVTTFVVPALSIDTTIGVLAKRENSGDYEITAVVNEPETTGKESHSPALAGNRGLQRSIMTGMTLPQKSSLKADMEITVIPEKFIKEDSYYVLQQGDYENPVSSVSLATAPEGYEEDTAFTNQNITVTLNAGNTWSMSFPEQDKCDKWGNEYIYFVQETECIPETYKLSAYGANDSLLTTSGLTVTNTCEEKKGDLELTKQVEGDGDTDKQFAFTINLTAPEGKELASSYEASYTGGTNSDPRNVTVTVTNGLVSGIELKDGETFTIKGLPAGTIYSIVENDYSADGYSSSMSPGAAGTIPEDGNAKASVTATNTYNPGTLTIEKVLDGNAALADSEKTFEFQVDLENAASANKNKGWWKKGTTETIEAADATAVSFDAEGKSTITFQLMGGEKVVFSKLPLGTTFTIKELSADQDGYETTVSTDGGTPAANKTVTGSIAASTSVTATYTNSKSTTSAEARKIWSMGGQVTGWPEDVDSVTFTLYKTVNNVETIVSTSDVAEIINPVNVDKNTTDFKASWDDLPTKYLENGTWYPAVYTVKETAVHYTQAGKNSGLSDLETEEAVTSTYGAVYDAANSIITNEIPNISVNATKQWKDKDGTVLTGTNIPTGAKVTFTLLADGVQTDPARTVELDGVDEAAGGANPAGNDYESAAWTANFTNLPKYNTAGTIINYTVQETGTWTGYSVEGQDTVETGGTITNKQLALKLDILKVEKGNHNKKIENVDFTLKQIDETVIVNMISYKTGGVTETVTTNNKGEASFEGIPYGYYEVKEDAPPAGYVFTGDDAFYIKVSDAGIQMLQKDMTKKAEDWTAISTGGIVYTFALAEGTTPALATVENTPGAELPSSGGPGTHLFYLLGSALAIFAAALLGMRRIRH